MSCKDSERFYDEVVQAMVTRPHFYQTRSAWSVDQGSNKNHSPAYNFAPTVTKFCVMWEGLSLPHDTKFGNCRCKIVDSRSFPSWSLIHGLRWSGLIKVGPGDLGIIPKADHHKIIIPVYSDVIDDICGRFPQRYKLTWYRPPRHAMRSQLNVVMNVIELQLAQT